MKLLIALLLWLSLDGPALAQPAAQRLDIRVRGDGAEATRLPQYDRDVPLAITVTGANQPLDVVTMVANSPDGEVERAPLLRTATGSYTGTMMLPVTGVWRLAISSRAGGLTTSTLPLELVVAPPPDANAGFIGLEVGAATFVLIGGGGFFGLRRLLGTLPARSLERPANAG